MKLLKFGGQSLAHGKPINNAIDIIRKEASFDDVAVVVSAMANSTDLLLQLYDDCKTGKRDLENWQGFNALCAPYFRIDKVSELLEQLHADLGLIETGNESQPSLDDVLAYGELISSTALADTLNDKGIPAKPIDSRKFLKGCGTSIDAKQSEMLTGLYFEHYDFQYVPIITGFLASNDKGETVTLGRNGSNYSASLVANYLNATEVQSWTNVDGIFTARPELVPDARLIESMTFQEAHELANFGANILHPKTIAPLMEKGITLKILNTLKPEGTGTTISKGGGTNGIKAVSVMKDVVLISIVGNGLLGRVGIDARIFKVLSAESISVRLISQASSERGIGFIIDSENGKRAQALLNKEFEAELADNSLSRIEVNYDMAIIAIVGKHNYSLEKAIYGLRRNNIWMHLISNSISGNHISLVVDEVNLQKALNIVHGQVFGSVKTLNVFCLGKGVVGSNLINQIIKTPKGIEEQRKLKVNVVGVSDTQRFIFNRTGVSEQWAKDLAIGKKNDALADIIAEIKASYLENVVFVDNTSSQEIVDQYEQIFKSGYDLVAANKKLNSGPSAQYLSVLKTQKKHGRLFYYETNVGAGLPIIDTLKHLSASADRITKIRGVFSGSLSYLFNTFSVADQPFSEVLEEAKAQGFTEPDPREDLSGRDVARKLIILAREIGIDTDLDKVEVQSLIPEALNAYETYDDFIGARKELDAHYSAVKESLGENEVLRYTGEVDCEKNTLVVSLIRVPKDSSLGGIKGADSIFEIFTEGYGDQPMVIQGAGAGGSVTARGVYSDLVRIGSTV